MTVSIPEIRGMKRLAAKSCRLVARRDPHFSREGFVLALAGFCVVLADIALALDQTNRSVAGRLRLRHRAATVPLLKDCMEEAEASLLQARLPLHRKIAKPAPSAGEGGLR